MLQNIWLKIKKYGGYVVAICLGIFLYYFSKEKLQNRDPLINRLKKDIKEKENKINELNKEIIKLDEKDKDYINKIDILHKEKIEIECSIDELTKKIENKEKFVPVDNVADAVKFVLNEVKKNS